MAIYCLKYGNRKHGLCKESTFVASEEEIQQLIKSELSLASRRVYKEQPTFLEPPIIHESWKKLE